jgi:DNA polymerase alpha subunit A
VVEEKPIFDLVPEDEFNSIAKRMMLEDDFVVDDNGEGYGAGGLEDWDAQHDSEYSGDSQDEPGMDEDDKSSKSFFRTLSCRLRMI